MGTQAVFQDKTKLKFLQLNRVPAVRVEASRYARRPVGVLYGGHHEAPGRHLAAHEAVRRAHGAVSGREHNEGELAPAAAALSAHGAVLNHCKI